MQPPQRKPRRRIQSHQVRQPAMSSGMALPECPNHANLCLLLWSAWPRTWDIPFLLLPISGSAGLRCCTGVWNLFSAGDLRGSQPTRSQQQFSARVSWAHLELWQCLPQYRLTTCITQCLQKQKWGLYLLYFPSFLCKLPLWWSDALGLTHRALETTQGTQGFIA